MHNTFIKMAQELEENILNNKIKMKTKEDWDKLKGIVWNLGELYGEEELESQGIIEDEDRTITIENCQKFTKLVWKFMKQMEVKHEKDFLKGLESIMHHLRFLVLYNRLGNYRRELVEEYEQECKKSGNIPCIEILDDFDKSLPIKRIKENDYPHFIESYNQQKEMHRNGRMEQIFDYNQDIINLQNEIIMGKLRIENITQWNIFKTFVHNFLESYRASFADLEKINHFGFRTDRSSFLDLIQKCIENIEEKYNGLVSKEDVPTLFDFIQVLCHHYVLSEKLKDIETNINKAPKFTGKNLEEGKVVANNKGTLVCIDKKTEEEYEKLESEIEKISAKYNEAQEFIFGMNLYESEENKRAI